MESNTKESTSCGCTGGCCEGLDRRDFVRLVGLGALVTLGSNMSFGAGPADAPGFDVNLPADKKLRPEWVKALFERGVPEVYRGEELRTILMPVGGICAGQLEISGEGKLTRWHLNELPMTLQQDFVLRTRSGGKVQTSQLNQHDFPALTFRGEYPIAKIDYQSAAVPVQVKLEAFSPFIPLNAAGSGLPATILNFTLTNTSAAVVEATLAGGLQNGVCVYHRFGVPGTRRNRITSNAELTVLACTAEPGPVETKGEPVRPEIIFEDWKQATYEGWTVQGTSFGSGPMERAVVEKKLGQLGGLSPRLVNSYLTGETNGGTGKLTSKPFTIDRRYINIWIGGGDIEGQTCVNLVVDGKTVQSQAGGRENRLSLHFFDVRELAGKQATLEIVDDSEAEWGQIGVGRITFSDVAGDNIPLQQLPDYGSMALALLGAAAQIAHAKGTIGFDGEASAEAAVPLAQTLMGTLGRTVQLQPGASAVVTFLVTWHFPNLDMGKLGKNVGRYYAQKYDSAEAVAGYVAKNFQRLAATTRLWRDTWYDSTLPYWFLDRTLINASTLATGGCYRFADGRFYAYESGSGCCEGTCSHVWQYAHTMGRLFPELERDTRERVDLGIALHADTGVSGFRGEHNMDLAIDGQAGTILRIYREHQMAPDGAFLKRNWDNIKKMYQPLFAHDADEDGILEGDQMNTLDQPWYGQISWMSSMYVAALRAGEQMAQERGDTVFAGRCRRIAENGTKNITARLYNGEYFINLVDPHHLNSVNSGTGCHIDQVYGQSWGLQLGLPRILPGNETKSALQALWKYNFSPDAGAYFTAHKEGRCFVSAGDAGLIVCTFPRPDWDYTKASGGGANHGFAYYFNETWTGNEYQVAGHMLWEGMALEGMAIVRAIHERYHPRKRNPWDEIECGGHYARAMASHGTYIGACGYEYHGPRGHLGFAPRLTPEKFRAAFTTAEGWGTYSQSVAAGALTAAIELKWGQLKLVTLALNAAQVPAASKVRVRVAGQKIDAEVSADGDKRIVRLARQVVLKPGQLLEAELYA